MREHNDPRQGRRFLSVLEAQNFRGILDYSSYICKTYVFGLPQNERTRPRLEPLTFPSGSSYNTKPVSSNGVSSREGYQVSWVDGDHLTAPILSTFRYRVFFILSPPPPLEGNPG